MYNYNYSLLLWDAIKNWLVVIIIIQLIFGFISATFANSKGYSFGWGFLLGFCVPLFGAVAVIGLLPEKNGEPEKTTQKNYISADSNLRKCPYCLESINKNAVVCRFCGKNIQEYDNEENSKREQKKLQREQEIKEIFKSITDLFNDENIMKEAKDLGRIYGKNFYVSYLKKKAKELCLGDIELNKDDVEL